MYQASPMKTYKKYENGDKALEFEKYKILIKEYVKTLKILIFNHEMLRMSYRKY